VLALRQTLARLLHPFVERVGVLRKRDALVLVEELARLFFLDVSLPPNSDPADVFPPVLERVHREPGERVLRRRNPLDVVGHLAETLQLALLRRERCKKPFVRGLVAIAFFQRVDTDRVRQVFLGVLQPAVKLGRLFGKVALHLLHLPVFGHLV